MKLAFPSEEWAKQLQVELNQSQDYAEAAATWEGDFYFVVDAGQGIAKEEVMYLDLCHLACMLADRTVKTPEFVIAAPLAAWKQVIGRKIDPIQALVTRKLKLQGNMLKIMKSVKAANELVRCTTFIPTQYPDEA